MVLTVSPVRRARSPIVKSVSPSMPALSRLPLRETQPQSPRWVANPQVLTITRGPGNPRREVFFAKVRECLVVPRSI
ncbi:hypothetical protein GCM10023194_27370 [Planotetraspora phitsanulokensis]|uniref:Uncharacterized protein n=1 Tax=Planotetraspora phitsanulokensis TaxID=575192 RepID=A0A8J3XD12_9ACTN|nr:hypothetical protein Pph01_11290 [Planotetraspora phitsanulokensis]